MSLELAKIGLNGFATAIQLIRAGKAHSLTDYAKATRVQPLCLVDADVTFADGTKDIMSTLLNAFAAYYLQAIAISANVGRVNVLSQLDRLNPNRNLASDAAFWDSAKFSVEQYQFGLPNYRKMVSLEAMPVTVAAASTPAFKATVSAGVGSLSKSSGDKLLAKPEMKGNDDTVTNGASDSKNFQAVVNENANLSVGKVIGVEIKDGDQSATIPVSIQFMANTVPSHELAHILSLGSEDTSTVARWNSWKAGDIDFWKDLVLTQDLITAHRKNLMKDKDGLYTAIKHRQSKNGIMGMLDMKPSLGTISNIAVISQATATQLELKINGSLSSPKVRERIFENTSLMILAVYDKDFERVKFYYHGISEASEASVASLRTANKGEGPNINDLLKAYSMGSGGML